MDSWTKKDIKNVQEKTLPIQKTSREKEREGEREMEKTKDRGR